MSSGWQRIAVVSDIHGNLPALAAVIAEIDAASVDGVVNLGDIVSGPLWPAETAARLMTLGWPAIAGNHERQLLAGPAATMGPADAHAAARLGAAQRGWLAALPATRWLADDLFCCHGTPDDDHRYLLETVTPDLGRHGGVGLRAASPAEIGERLAAARAALAPATLLLCGHSHVPRAVQQGRWLLVNPGSVGLQAFDDDHPHEHRAELGSPHARWALVERAAGGLWCVQHRATPYDWEAAARQAEINGRGDWADALRTGRVGRLEREVVRG
ncbi:MAG: metallophosphoesterase family protein [Burkholderiaceae bacterium]|nr:metallophosphoesterase family protein [Burkholderiaceae bacterium]